MVGGRISDGRRVRNNAVVFIAFFLCNRRKRLSRSISNAGRLICRWPRAKCTHIRRDETAAGYIQCIVLIRWHVDESYAAMEMHQGACSEDTVCDMNTDEYLEIDGRDGRGSMVKKAMFGIRVFPQSPPRLFLLPMSSSRPTIRVFVATCVPD